VVFTCDKCKAQTATPSMFDAELTEVACGSCGTMLSAEKHGTIVSPKRPRVSWLAGFLQKLRGK
jgi:ribosomal protein S27E